MLGLAFQNPDMTFFTSYEDGECHLCSKRTRSFFLVSFNVPLCLDCFDVFFAKKNNSHSHAVVFEGGGYYGGQSEGF